MGQSAGLRSYSHLGRGTFCNHPCNAVVAAYADVDIAAATHVTTAATEAEPMLVGDAIQAEAFADPSPWISHPPSTITRNFRAQHKLRSPSQLVTGSNNSRKRSSPYSVSNNNKNSSNSSSMSRAALLDLDDGSGRGASTSSSSFPSSISDQKVGSHQPYRYESRYQEPTRRPSQDPTTYYDCKSAPDQEIGIDALQSAFSAKFYELANKCKNWEKYAAKLRAQLEVTEAENRVLQEQNNQLEADNVRLQADLRQAVCQQRRSTPDDRLAPPPTRGALQSKRRSTVSVANDRGPSLSLAQIVKGALTASGVVARSSPGRAGSMQGSYDSQHKQRERHFALVESGRSHTSHDFVPRPPSRAASRLSMQSGVPPRSRSGSVQDAIPVAVEDVFCDQMTYKAHSTEGSPIGDHLAHTPQNPNQDLAAASQRLVAATDKLVLEQEPSATSPAAVSDSSAASTPSHSGSMTFERKLYIRFQKELTADEFFKFERCIQRYDFLDIPLEGPKGLITRVKRLLLVSDPDLRSKPEKLRIRQQLARDFDGMAKHFVQVQIPAAAT